jgi:serine O-acetyltransferase
VSESNLILRAGSVQSLARYIASQLNSLFPASGAESDLQQIMPILPTALDRLRPIVSAVTIFQPGSFNHFHSLQYASLLYLLGNVQWRLDSTNPIGDRLFCLNRALNSLDLYNAVSLPEVFFISHGLGTVLGNATYGTRLVVFQNVTVGRVGKAKPVIGSDVVLYPGAVVTGDSVVGEKCVVAAGTVIHGVQVPDNTIVTSHGSELVFEPRKRDYTALYFRANA